jgi:fermentation-respiration switch protein FrsA (DUF1100 family)
MPSSTHDEPESGPAAGSTAPPAKAGWRRRTRRIAVRILAWYLVWICMALVLQRAVLFPRSYAQTMDSPGEGVVGLEQIWLETDEGNVEGWFVPGRGVTADRPGPLVIYAHGNAEVIDYFPYVLAPYTARGVSLMLIEFRGYGRSAGSPSQKRITEDYVHFYDLIATRPEVDRDRIIFHGRSVGAGVVCSLARHRSPAMMILQSPFSSVRSMMARYLVPPFLCLDPFDNAAVVRQFDGPILIMHGRRDEVIPFAHGRSLHALATAGVFSEFDCGHNDFPTDSDRYWNETFGFLEEHGILPRRPPVP